MRSAQPFYKSFPAPISNQQSAFRNGVASLPNPVSRQLQIEDRSEAAKKIRELMFGKYT
jgi:hypothetical protein